MSGITIKDKNCDESSDQSYLSSGDERLNRPNIRQRKIFVGRRAKITKNKSTICSRIDKKVTKEKAEYAEKLDTIYVQESIQIGEIINIYQLPYKYHTAVQHCICGNCSHYFSSLHNLKRHCRDKHKNILEKGSVMGIKDLKKQYDLSKEGTSSLVASRKDKFKRKKIEEKLLTIENNIELKNDRNNNVVDYIRLNMNL